MIKILLIFATPLAKLFAILIDAWQTRKRKAYELEAARRRNAELAQREAAIDALDAAQRRDDADETMSDTLDYDRKQLEALGTPKK